MKKRWGLILFLILFAGLLPCSSGTGPAAYAAAWAGSVGDLNADSSPATGSIGSFEWGCVSIFLPIL